MTEQEQLALIRYALDAAAKVAFSRAVSHCPCNECDACRTISKSIAGLDAAALLAARQGGK